VAAVGPIIRHLPLPLLLVRCDCNLGAVRVMRPAFMTCIVAGSRQGTRGAIRGHQMPNLLGRQLARYQPYV
jgi:hypothetical protein